MISATGNAVRFLIPEDSLQQKLLCCIPVVGLFFLAMHDSSLSSRIERCRDPQKITALIDVQNDYKIAGIVNKLLIIATLISAVAFNFFPIMGALSAYVSEGAGCAIISTICACWIGVDVWQIFHNKWAISYNLPR